MIPTAGTKDVAFPGALIEAVAKQDFTGRRVRMRGFSLFELVVVTMVVTVVSGVLLARVLPLTGQAERIAFEQTRQRLQSALLLEAAERVARGESGTLSMLSGTNPIELLPDPPVNYLGTLTEISDRRIPGQSWYYDDEDETLSYRPGSRTSFVALEGPPDRIDFRVDFVFSDRDHDGAFNASVDRFDGLRLQSLHRYSWADD